MFFLNKIKTVTIKYTFIKQSLPLTLFEAWTSCVCKENPIPKSLGLRLIRAIY